MRHPFFKSDSLFYDGTCYAIKSFGKGMEMYTRKYCFCTIVNRDYLFKGLTLYFSLCRHSNNFHLYICCMDKLTYFLLSQLNLQYATLLSINDIENNRLMALKKSRTEKEYCQTVKASCVLYVFRRYRSVQSLIYIDADLFFFSNPKPIFTEWGNGSILICPQRTYKSAERKDGIYNSGLVGFKRDKNAMDCLKWWREKCMEWCYDRHEEERWVDQKYLNQWPGMFNRVKVCTHLGINAAPWNVGYRKYPINVQVKNKKPYINNDKLIVYHYSGFTILNQSEFNVCPWRKIKANEYDFIFLPYIKALKKSIGKVTKIMPEFSYGFCKNENLKKTGSYVRH